MCDCIRSREGRAISSDCDFQRPFTVSMTDGRGSPSDTVHHIPHGQDATLVPFMNRKQPAPEKRFIWEVFYIMAGLCSPYWKSLKWMVTFHLDKRISTRSEKSKSMSDAYSLSPRGVPTASSSCAIS